MAKELILKGRVQGVACRYYCSQYGRKIGVRGAASNLYSGDVQVLLDTDDETVIEKYVRALRTNPLKVHFWGTITGIEIRDYGGPLSGDYTF